MNTVNVNDYLANVAQVVRKCPTPTLRHAYMRAYREWCQQTLWLRANIPGATVVGDAQYSLGNDPQLDIIGIVGMEAAWTPPSGQVQKWALQPSQGSGWNPNVATGSPQTYQYVPEAQFALYPTPALVVALQVTVILVPKEAAVNVPEAPLMKYSNDIEAGALEYLLMLRGMPWSDPVSAQMYGKAFRSGISNGKAEVQRSYNTGAQRARGRFFVGSRNALGWY